MKAIICKKSGPPNVLKLEEVEKPIPRPNEILVKVYASSVTKGDVVLRKIPRLILLPVGVLFGFKAMKIPGVEFAGKVEEVGDQVERFKPGDHVFGTTTGLKFGGNAEYVCVPEKPKKGVVLKKPKNLSFSEASVIPVGAMTALYFLRKGKVQKDQKVLIYGASGSVGTYAIQLAKSYQAHVTGVCSTNNMALIKSLGADEVLDYTQGDLTKGENTYDLIFDAVGKLSRSQCKPLLKNNGAYLSVKQPTKEKVEDLESIKELIEAEKVIPVIDRYYTLDQVIEAHRYVETGRKKGNVGVTIKHGDP